MATSAPPIPRVELAYAPTPLLKLERLSAELGVELWVKRDDLTGLLETGNKIRKLEFLVGEALAQRADTLITCGTLQSNCCRAVAAVAARLGLKAMLALKGAAPAEYDGNLLLDRLLGAEIRYCTDDEWEKVDRAACRRWPVERGRRGGRPTSSPRAAPPSSARSATSRAARRSPSRSDTAPPPSTRSRSPRSAAAARPASSWPRSSPV